MISGSLVALITPFQADGSVDFEALDRLVEWHIDQGTHGIVVVGTTGEAATLTNEELLSVISRCVAKANGRVPVIAGTGANATPKAIELTRQAAEAGVDACLVVTPYYIKPTQRGMHAHFTAIADACDIDVILYNVPGRTGVDLQNATVLELSRHPRIVGIKDATGDVDRGAELTSLVSDDFAVYSGDDATALELIAHGAKGNISVTANVQPKLMSKAVEAALSGDRDLANTINARLIRLHSDLFVESNPIPVKYAVSQLGLCANELRLPLTPLDDQYKNKIDEALKAAVDH